MAACGPLLLAACASDGGSSSSSGVREDSAEPGVASPAATEAPAATAAGKGIQAGWMDYRPAKKANQVNSLTLVGASTEAGRLIASGRARMDGGKVVDDRTAADLVEAFESEGFSRFALRRSPNEPIPGAIASVWLDRGNGPETLFFTAGARQNPKTEALPDVYDHLKKLVFTVHQATPGSMVVTGEGWSGDDMFRRNAEGRGR